MEPDMYRIKVLNYLNPHLIWVEVLNTAEEIVFEQIGIYGVLPLDTILDMEGVFKSRRSEIWMPAASVVMMNTLADAEEIWFYPIHIDRRSSIFSNNIHKYGDIVVKKINGKKKHVSKQLNKSGFAICDVPQFHRELSLGKIRTKPTEVQAKDVIKHLREHFYNTQKKTQWEEWVKKQTYIYHMIQNIEIQNEINMHKGEKTRKQLDRLKIIQNKLKDLDLCSGVDEESVGRGIVRNSDTSESNSPPSKLKLLKWKMRMSKETSELYTEDSSSLTDSTEPECDVYHVKKMQNDFLNNSANSEDTSLDESLAEAEQSHIDKRKVGAKKPLEKEIECLNGCMQKYAQISMKAQKAMRNEPPTTVRVAYGPPDLDIKRLNVKIMPRVQDQDNNSENIEDTNNNTQTVTTDVVRDIVRTNNVEELGSAPDTKILQHCEQKTKLSKSLLLQRKLKQHKEKLSGLLDSSIADGDNAAEEPKQKNKVNNVTSDDESISDLIEKLNLKKTTRRIPKKELVSQETYLLDDNPKINANPFRNLDGSKSVFVDKLINTVLMVHTKKNNKIQPFSNIRDVPFTQDIQVVLRNMGVKAPTSLQTVSWTTVLRGHSVFMVGPLGCGKTMGYLPAVCRLTSDSHKQNPDTVYPTCIIVCATSKSVSEVEKCSKMLFGLHERVLACYAGMDELTVTTSLLNGCDLLICTPPVLARLLQAELGVDLRALTTFVIDDCERISEVYADETKLALYEIKKVLKSRANKEIKVQFVVASRVWSDFMESLAKKSPDTVVCIGSFQECVLYSKTRMSVDFVKKENKINAVLDFLEKVEGRNKTVIVCRYDDEVEFLEETLTKLKHAVFACNNAMTIHDLYNLNIAWGKYEEPTIRPILICCDGNLAHLNVTDAHYLLHYSMPSLFSTFSKRFSVLNDNYPSIFTQHSQTLRIKVLLEETNAEQLPKILNFVKRCTNNIPVALNDLSNKVIACRDIRKAKELFPICDTMLSFGHCADFWNCKERHAILKEYDEPKDWMPVDGSINFKILHYHSADLYSVRLLSNTTNGQMKKYPQTYSTLSLKMGMFYSKESNRRLHGTPKLGDMCAVSIKLNFFVRCQVVKILNHYRNGNPKHVLLRLIDEEKFEMSKDIHLYYLPEELRAVQTYVVQVRLANIRPQDNDVTYSDLAKNRLKKITDTDEDLYLRGYVTLAVSNCVFVDTLEACQDLSSLNGTVVRYNFKKELLDLYAELNPNHIPTLKTLCQGLKLKEETIAEPDVSKSLKLLPKCRWAHLNSDELSSIFLTSAENPDKFFVRLTKFQNCMDSLVEDINTYVKKNSEPVKEINKGDIVLAKFPDDCMYERARIDHIYEGKVKCFFVDQGDWRDVSTNHLVPITDRFITQMPFQAIECRLIGVKPAGEEWTEFCTNWFCDYSFEDGCGNVRQMYIKYFAKTTAECTDGHKYGVALVDTNSTKDVIVNHLIVDLNLAQINEDEIEYLDNMTCMDNKQEISDSDSNDGAPKKSVVTYKKMMSAPLRSVPLVDSDNESEDIDKWDFNTNDDFMSMVNPNLALKTSTKRSESTDKDSTENLDEIISENIENKMAIVPIKNLATYTKAENTTNDSKNKPSKDAEIQKHDLAKDLPAADLTKPVNLQNEISKVESFDDTQLRKPKLTWYQNKNLVIIKIHLIGVDDYVLNIKNRCIQFFAEQNDTKYGFQIDLYGVVHITNTSHANKGQYILVKLTKIMKKNWLTLSRDGNIRKWIVYDVDRIDTSSCDEDTDNSILLDTIKNIHEKEESDTEEEEFTDDVTYSNPRHA